MYSISRQEYHQRIKLTLTSHLQTISITYYNFSHESVFKCKIKFFEASPVDGYPSYGKARKQYHQTKLHKLQTEDTLSVNTNINELRRN